MWSEDDFQYAIENTEVIVAPQSKIATFGHTSFRFYLISELMDEANKVRVRDGQIHAERPQILTADHFSRVLLDGFGEKAVRFLERLRTQQDHMAVLRYGFQFRKTGVSETTVHASLASVIEQTRTKVERAEEPLSAVIKVSMTRGKFACLSSRSI